MALATFLHADGNYNNTANWSTGAVPVDDTDYVYIPPGSQSITSGMDQTAVNLLGFETAPGYTGNIGASGSPLRITSNKVVLRGTGSTYYQDENDAGTNTDATDIIIVDCPANLNNALTLTGTNVDALIVYSGGVSVGATTVNYGFMTTSQSTGFNIANVSLDSSWGTEWIVEQGTLTSNVAPSSPSRLHVRGGLATGIIQSVYGLTMTGGKIKVSGAIPAANDVINGDIRITGGELDITDYRGSTFGNSLTVNADFIASSNARIKRREDQTLTAEDVLYVAPGVEVTQ